MSAQTSPTPNKVPLRAERVAYTHELSKKAQHQNENITFQSKTTKTAIPTD